MCRFLESLLNHSIGRCTLSLPELHIFVDHSGSSLLNQIHHVKHMEKKSEQNKTSDNTSSDKKRTRKNLSKACLSSDSNDKLRQPKILDVLRKAGAVTSQDVPNENSSTLSSKESSAEPSQQHSSDFSEPMVIEISAAAKALKVRDPNSGISRFSAFPFWPYQRLVMRVTYCITKLMAIFLSNLHSISNKYIQCLNEVWFAQSVHLYDLYGWAKLIMSETFKTTNIYHERTLSFPIYVEQGILPTLSIWRFRNFCVKEIMHPAFL